MYQTFIFNDFWPSSLVKSGGRGNLSWVRPRSPDPRGPVLHRTGPLVTFVPPWFSWRLVSGMCSFLVPLDFRSLNHPFWSGQTIQKYGNFEAYAPPPPHSVLFWVGNRRRPFRGGIARIVVLCSSDSWYWPVLYPTWKALVFWVM